METVSTGADAAAPSRRITPLQALAGVAACYALAQLVVVGVHHYFGYDEAVYYAKASSRVVAVPWSPIRSLGLPWLIRPVATLTTSVAAMRAWLLVCSCAGLFLAWWPWVRLMRGSAVAGAALFAFSWLGLFFGSAAYPNLPTAVAVVGGAGWAVVAATSADASWGAYAGAVAGFAIAATVRPTDATLELLGAATVLLVACRLRAMPALVASAGGLLLGWLVWVIEAYVDFGGPLHRWRAAFGHIHGFALRTFLFTTAVAPRDAPITSARMLFAIAWWAVLAVAAVSGLFVAPRSGAPARIAAATAFGAAVPLLAAYVLLPSEIEPRFLIPVYAALAVPAGAGLWSVLTTPVHHRSWRNTAVAVVASLALIAIYAWHIDSARTTVDFAARRGALLERTGHVVRERASGRPCVIAADDNAPILAVSSGCPTTKVLLGTVRRLPAPFAERTDGSTARYLVTRTPPRPSAPFASWPMTRVETRPGDDAFVFQPPGQH